MDSQPGRVRWLNDVMLQKGRLRLREGESFAQDIRSGGCPRELGLCSSESALSLARAHDLGSSSSDCLLAKGGVGGGLGLCGGCGGLGGTGETKRQALAISATAKGLASGPTLLILVRQALNNLYF